MPKQQTTKRPRAALIGKVHAIVKQLGYDDDTYRTILLTQTGKTSCKDLSVVQLSRLADALSRMMQGKPMPEHRARNAPQPSAPSLAGQTLPTAKQWETLEGLCRRAGWTGLEDIRMLAFSHHTAKVVELGDLSRTAMSKVISGMSRMLAQRSEREIAKDNPRD